MKKFNSNNLKSSNNILKKEFNFNSKSSENNEFDTINNNNNDLLNNFGYLNTQKDKFHSNNNLNKVFDMEKRGSNKFVIMATNTNGTTSAETNLKYSPRVAQESKPVITLTSISTPTANPFNPNVSGSTIIGNVKNASKKDQITITHNGNKVTDFTFNSRTGVFQLSISLANEASNKVKFSATNSSGTATKEHTY
mgnify:CR=1 FL=1